MDASRADGTLTAAPGEVSFEAKNRKSERRDVTYQCSSIKRVEQGQSAFVPPHVNLYIAGPNGKDVEVMFYTSRSTGLFSPPTNITTEVLNGIIEACALTRIKHGVISKPSPTTTT